MTSVSQIQGRSDAHLRHPNSPTSFERTLSRGHGGCKVIEHHPLEVLMITRSFVSIAALSLAALSAVATSYMPWMMVERDTLQVTVDTDQPAAAYHFDIAFTGEAPKKRKTSAVTLGFSIAGQLAEEPLEPWDSEEFDTGFADMSGTEDSPTAVRITLLSDNGGLVPAPVWVDLSEAGTFEIEALDALECYIAEWAEPCAEGYTILVELDGGEVAHANLRIEAMVRLGMANEAAPIDTVLTLDVSEVGMAWE
jgi:hypothetical protein